MRGIAVTTWGGTSTLAVGIVAIMGSGGVIPEAGAAQPAPTSTTTPPTETPIVNVLGTQALWFIGVLALVVALLWAVPLIYDTREANRWRRQHQVALLDKMIGRAGTLSVEEIRQIVSAIDTQPRGTQGLTQSLLGLIVATFVGVAMIATLVSTAADSSDLRKTIVTALLSILGVIAGFYLERARHRRPQNRRHAHQNRARQGLTPPVVAAAPVSSALIRPAVNRGSLSC